MFEIDRVPDYVYQVIAGHGIEKKDIYIISYSDKNNDDNYGDTYIFATSQVLGVLSGTVTYKLDRLNVKQVCEFTENYYIEYLISSVKNIQIEELISNSRLTAQKENGDYFLVANLSNFCRNSTRIFLKYFNRIASGDIVSSDFEIDEDDLPEYTCCPKCNMRYPDPVRKVCPRCMDKGKIFKRFGVFLNKYRVQIGLMVLTLVLITATGIISPYLSSGFFYDEVLDENGKFYAQILLVVGIVVVTKLLSHLFNSINLYVSAVISAKMVFDLKKSIFDAIERLSLSFFSGRQTGGLMSQVNNDANSIYSFFCDGVPAFLINIVQVIVLVTIAFTMNPLLALISLLPVPIYVVIIKTLYKKSVKYHARNYSTRRAMDSVLSDVFSGMRVVKAFSREQDEINKFENVSNEAAKAQMKTSVYHSTSYPFAGLVLFAGNVIALGVGGWMVISGYQIFGNAFTYGKLMTFLAYLNMIYSPLNFFTNMSDWTAACANAIQRLFEILDTKPEICEPDIPADIQNIKGKVEFSHVDFSYTKRRKTINDVTFKVEAGQSLGIVGHTGAGKSTIANLIMRLYDCESGDIYIDDVNIKEISLKTLHDNIAIVSQETYLFVGTIYDNIKYAKPDATYEEVINAAKSAGAHSFIMKYPDAYNTKIGMGYKDLSGGEKQRISIARAMLKDPAILILDEATAAMDTKTERLIQNALAMLTENKTTITIAHRLSTLRDADRLIVIEDGRVAEEGTHGELLQKDDGVYKRLYTLQIEALKNAGIA